MSWVIKGAGSLRRFFWVPTTCIVLRKLKEHSKFCISNCYNYILRHGAELYYQSSSLLYFLGAERERLIETFPFGPYNVFM